MSRIRTIKPDFPASASVGRLSRDARLFIVQLWTETDDEGRLEFLPRKIAGILYPHDDDVTPADIERWAAECESEGMILRYTVSDRTYLFVTGFPRHQKINRPSPSRIPPPPDTNTHGTLSESSVSPQRELSAGNRKVESGSRKSSPSGEEAPAGALDPFGFLPESHRTPEVESAWADFAAMRRRKRYGAWQEETLQAQCKQWAGYSPEEVAAALSESARSEWKGVFPKKHKKTGGGTVQDKALATMEAIYGTGSN
jgi:hypothetical protein